MAEPTEDDRKALAEEVQRALDTWRWTMQLIAQKRQILPSPDGGLDYDTPDGNDNILLLWDNPNLPTLTGLTGAVSINLRQYLSGAWAPFASISLVRVSGEEPSGAGWVAPGTGNNLVRASGAQANGSFYFLATYLGKSRRSVTVPWSFVVAVGADTYAPPMPYNVSVAKVSETSVDVSWDPVSDPYIEDQNASGMKEYVVLDGNNPVGGVVPVVAGTSLQLTVQQIGFPVPVPTLTQDGADLTFTSGGDTGFRTTASKGSLAGYQVSGDFIATVRITEHLGAVAANTNSGILITETLDPGSKMAYGLLFPTSATTPDCRMNYRAATNSDVTFGVSATDFTPPNTLTMERRGDLITFRAGGQQIAQQTISMAQTVWVGVPLASRTAGQAATVKFTDFSVTPLQRQTKRLTGLAAGAHTFRVQSRDIAGNTSNASPTAGVAITLAPAVQPINYFMRANASTPSSDKFIKKGGANSKPIVSTSMLYRAQRSWYFKTNAEGAPSVSNLDHYRSENGTGFAGGNAPYGKRLYYGWAYRFAPGWATPQTPANTGLYQIVAQWHGASDKNKNSPENTYVHGGVASGEEDLNPNISLYANNNGKWSLGIRGDSRQVVPYKDGGPKAIQNATYNANRTVVTGGTVVKGSYERSKTYDSSNSGLGNFPLDRWFVIQVECVFNYGNPAYADPYFKMWIDDVLVVDDVGINCYNDGENGGDGFPPYMEHGQYMGTKTIQIDNPYIRESWSALYSSVLDGSASDRSAVDPRLFPV